MLNQRGEEEDPREAHSSSGIHHGSPRNAVISGPSKETEIGCQIAVLKELSFPTLIHDRAGLLGLGG